MRFKSFCKEYFKIQANEFQAMLFSLIKFFSKKKKEKKNEQRKSSWNVVTKLRVFQLSSRTLAGDLQSGYRGDDIDSLAFLKISS